MGPKGGLYVMHNGKKVYKFKRAPKKGASPPARNAGHGTNIKGRTIFTGPKGGLYVMHNGKKVYKFKRAPKSDLVKNRLIKLAQTVKKRAAIVPIPSSLPKVNIQFEQFTYSEKDMNLIKGKRSLRLKKSIEVINSLNNSVMGPRTADLPSQKWIDSQIAYINNLSTYDFYTAMAYTVRSHEWIGKWMYYKNISTIEFSKTYGMIAPLYPQVSIVAKEFDSDFAKEFVRLMRYEPDNLYSWYKENINYMPEDILYRAINLYVKDLDRIIRRAPPLDKAITVYRGVVSDIFKGKIGAVHSLQGFTSTSYVPRYEYAGRMYLRIKVLKGSRVLLLQALNTWDSFGEFEILLNTGSKYIIRKRDLKRPVVNNSNIRDHLATKYVTDITLT
jgi:hypothetical protein